MGRLFCGTNCHMFDTWNATVFGQRLLGATGAAAGSGRPAQTTRGMGASGRRSQLQNGSPIAGHLYSTMELSRTAQSSCTPATIDGALTPRIWSLGHTTTTTMIALPKDALEKTALRASASTMPSLRTERLSTYGAHTSVAKGWLIFRGDTDWRFARLQQFATALHGVICWGKMALRPFLT